MHIICMHGHVEAFNYFLKKGVGFVQCCNCSNYARIASVSGAEIEVQCHYQYFCK